VVEPGVDLGPSAPPGNDASASAQVNSQAFKAPVRLLCVATLVPRKGHAVLLEALGGLQDDAWTLDIVGSETRDEATARRLRALAASLGLDDRIRWHGEMDERGVEERYVASDVFVLPSFYEGYGMVVTEALAHGLPVVTTTGGALARTLPTGAGLHVPPGDVTALREALRSVINNDALRSVLADGARRAAAALPAWEAAAARFAAVLSAVETGEC
jgi:glycosyltransferase involved in cell wall biosynthesis